MKHDIDRQAARASGAEHRQGLEMEGLRLELGGRMILSDISIALPGHGICCLIGPSGAGKSSLLRCINRLYEGWRGDIRLAGISVRDHEAAAIRRNIGLIGQKPAVFPCSIRDNVTFGLPRRQRRRIDEQALRQALEQAALWGEVRNRLHEPADQLSLGQQQRLCLARALILKPSMLLLDEPTSALDPRSRDIIEHSLSALAGSMPLLWVTHDLEQVRRIAGRIMFVCDGRLIEEGEARAFFSRPARLESREFLRWSVCNCPEPS